MTDTLRQRLSNRRLIVDLLALMFGVGSWIGVNGVYVQLPLLVNKAPEGWSLPAYLVVLVQIANLGPLFYSLSTRYARWVRDRYIIYWFLGMAPIAILGMAFTHDKTSMIFGKERSAWLLGLMFVAAVVGCTSSVLFMPYMRNYREIYLVAYLVGEGLSGLVPSGLALVQGVGGNPECVNTTRNDSATRTYEMYYPKPNFSSQFFFIFVTVLLTMSFLAFVGLNKLNVALGERVKQPSSTETLPTDTNAPPSYKTTSGWTMSKRLYAYQLCMMAVICFLGHSILPSIQSYSCLPYGNMAYHLTVTLSSIASPLAMCLGFVMKQPKSPNFLTYLTAAILALSSFVLYLAVQSPTPPLQHSWIGNFIVVIPWILVNGLIGFVKMCITTRFRPDPGRGLYYIGVSTQVGSLAGASIIFVLVNYTETFQSYSPCTSLTGH